MTCINSRCGLWILFQPFYPCSLSGDPVRGRRGDPAERAAQHRGIQPGLHADPLLRKGMDQSGEI